MAVPNSPLNPNYQGPQTPQGGPTTGPMTAAELQTLYGFASVVPDAGGGFVAYIADAAGGNMQPVARFVRGADGTLVQEYKAPGSGAQPASGQYINGPGGKVYYAAPYGGGLTLAGDIGQDPNWTPLNNKMTGTSRLFDPNSGRSIDLGQTDFPGMDPREAENARRLESDRLFAYQQARDAEASARADREFEAAQDLQNRQLGLSAARDLTGLSQAEKERTRQILQGASDFVYRSFVSRGKAAPEPYVSHADLIGQAASEFDKLASIYQQALTPKPMSSSGRLAPPPTFNPLPQVPAAAAPPSGGGAPAPSTPAASQGIPNWGPLPGGGYGITGYSQPAPSAPAAMAGGGGGGGYLQPPAAPAPQQAGGVPVISMGAWNSAAPNAGYLGVRGGPEDVPYSPQAPYTGVTGSPAIDKLLTGLFTNGASGSYVDRYRNEPTGGGGYLRYEVGGRAPADEPYIVGENGYEVVLPRPDGSADVIPHDVATRLVAKDGKVKKGGRLKGYEDGTFFSGWNGQDATAAISAFNAAQGVSTGGGFAPGGSAPTGGMTGVYGPTTGGWKVGQGSGVSTALPSGITTDQYGQYHTGDGMVYGDLALAQQHMAYTGGQRMPSVPTTPAVSQAPDWLTQLIATLRPQVKSQDQILADEQRLRPPAVDSILGGTDMPNLNIVGPNGVGSPQLASRLALGKLTPDELTALNTSLGVRYNSTLDDYLAASDQRYLAGAGQRRLRARYR